MLGHGNEKFSDDELIGVVKAQEPTATVDVANALDVTRQAVDARLKKLRNQGRLTSEKYGGSLVWSTP